MANRTVHSTRGPFRKWGAALVLMFGLLSADAGLAAQQNEEPKTPPTLSAKMQEHKDERGDPLPEAALLRFGSAHLRHGGTIRTSTLSPDGKFLATAGDHSVIVWDLSTGKVKHHFPSEVSACLAFSPDGTRLACVRSSLSVCLWDLRTEKVQKFERPLESGQSPINYWCHFCQFSKQGKELVLLCTDAIETLNLESGQVTNSLPVRARLLTPDGKMYLRFAEQGGRLLGEVVLGDTHTGKEWKRFKAVVQHNGVAFSSDGKTLALVHDNREIQVRTTAGGMILASFPLPDSAVKKIEIPNRETEKCYEYRIAFSTDGKTLLLGTVGGLIHRWDLATYKELPALAKHYCPVTGMHTLPDGRTLVSTGQDGIIRRWNLETGWEQVGPYAYEGHSQAAYSPDGRYAIIADIRGRIDLWDGRTAKLVRTLQEEGTSARDLAFAPDGTLLACAQSSGTVKFWHIPSGQPGNVWRRETLRDEWGCNGIRFSSDGRLLYISDYPRRIRLLEVASGKLVWKAETCGQGEAFSPDGARLLIAEHHQRTFDFITFDAKTGKQLATFELDFKMSMLGRGFPVFTFSPDGRRLALAHDIGVLKLCDGRSYEEQQRLVDNGLDYLEAELAGKKMANLIEALAFSPDSKWLASAGFDGEITIWETATGKEVLRLRGHEAEVSTLAFRPDGRTLFSYGQDGQGYLWNLKPKPEPGTRTTLNELWTDLAATDARKAYRAGWAISADPRGVDFLRKKLSAALLLDKARLAKRIADLDDDRFEVREAASKALAELGEQAKAALEQARKTTTSLEQRRRLDELLSSLKDRLSPFQILQLRAVQALELAGTEEARQALKEWASGDPAALLTQDAKAALARLEKGKR